MSASPGHKGEQIPAPVLSNAFRLAEDSERCTIEHESENAPRRTESSEPPLLNLRHGRVVREY